MVDRTKDIDKEIKDGDNQWSGSWFHLSREELEEVGLGLWKPEVGTNFIVIVPPNEPGYFGKKINVHYEVGPSKSAFLCRKQMLGEACPLCEERGRVISNASEDEKPEIPKALKSIPSRYMFWILDMKDAETMAKGVQLYIAPRTVNDNLKTLCMNKRTGEVIDISNPENHFNVMFTRTGKGQYDTKYISFEKELRVAADKGEKALKEDKEQIDEYTSGLPKFEELLIWADYETIEAEYFGPKGRGESPVETTEEPEEPQEAKPERRRGPTIPDRGAVEMETAPVESPPTEETTVAAPMSMRERLAEIRAKRLKDLEG